MLESVGLVRPDSARALAFCLSLCSSFLVIDKARQESRNQYKDLFLSQKRMLHGEANTRSMFVRAGIRVVGGR